MFDLDKLSVKDVENLLSGGRYRVLADFADAAGGRHRAGEEWTFRRAEYRHGEKMLALFVDREGGEAEIPLALWRGENAPGLGRLKEWFEMLASPVYQRQPEPAASREPDLTAEPAFRAMADTPEWRAFEERLRAALRLAKDRRYEEASSLIDELVSGSDQGDGPIQSVAHRLGEAAASVAGKNDELAEWLREQSTSLWYTWASWATSGGEGTARVRQLQAMGIWPRRQGSK